MKNLITVQARMHFIRDCKNVVKAHLTPELSAKVDFLNQDKSVGSHSKSEK